MFCVECGTEGPVYEGLCAKCFRKRYAVVQPIELLDVARCESCGSHRLRSGWSKVDRELALPQLLREAMAPLAPYERVGFTQVTRDEDANNLALTVKAVGRFQDLAVVQDFHVRVRTGARDLHSGLFGGAALNAMHALMQTLSGVLPDAAAVRNATVDPTECGPRESADQVVGVTELPMCPDPAQRQQPRGFEQPRQQRVGAQLRRVGTRPVHHAPARRAARRPDRVGDPRGRGNPRHRPPSALASRRNVALRSEWMRG